MKARLIKADEKRTRTDYERTEPKQFGNLHERMKFLMVCVEKHGEAVIPHDVRHAIWDLQTEVMHHKPITPPFGQRFNKKP
jgi:hypothetical protein